MCVRMWMCARVHNRLQVLRIEQEGQRSPEGVKFQDIGALVKVGAPAEVGVYVWSVYMRVHVGVYSCVSVCACVYVCMHVHALICVCASICLGAYACVYVCKQVPKTARRNGIRRCR